MIIVPASFFASHQQFAGTRCGPYSCAPRNTRATQRSTKKSLCKSASRLIHKPQISTTETEYEISMDIPGIKVQDITINQESNGGLKVEATRRFGGHAQIDLQPCETKYHREFMLNPKTMILDNITASLEDGVLTIRIPKKPVPEPFTVPLVSEEAPETAEDDADKNVSVTLELPGVKLANVTISAMEDNISIVTERKARGSSSLVLKRTFSVDEDAVDLREAKAYLQDGILTILAPKKVAKDNDDVDNRPRFIPVSVEGTNSVTAVTNVEDEDEKEYTTVEEETIAVEDDTQDDEHVTHEADAPSTEELVAQAEDSKESSMDEDDVVLVEDVNDDE